MKVNEKAPTIIDQGVQAAKDTLNLN